MCGRTCRGGNNSWKAGMVWGILPNTGMEQSNLFTDASWKWGCGGIWNTRWFQWKWNEKAVNWHIVLKELLRVLLACIIWGKEWSGKRVICHCDNMAVVEVLNSGYSKDKDMMHLLRCLFFISEYHHFLVEAVHLPGKSNDAANAPSRDNISRLLQVLPEAQLHPTPIPTQVLHLLVEKQPDWISKKWTELFSTCTRQD